MANAAAGFPRYSLSSFFQLTELQLFFFFQSGTVPSYKYSLPQIPEGLLSPRDPLLANEWTQKSLEKSLREAGGFLSEWRHSQYAPLSFLSASSLCGPWR